MEIRAIQPFLQYFGNVRERTVRADVRAGPCAKHCGMTKVPLQDQPGPEGKDEELC